MLQVGARASEAALSLASGASSLSPMVWRSSGSKVAPIAVDDYCNINRMSSLRVKKGAHRRSTLLIESATKDNDYQERHATYEEYFGWGAHQEMIASNAIGTIADLDSGYPQPLDSVSVPETDARDQRNGLIGGQFFENLRQVRPCKIRGRHLRSLRAKPLGPKTKNR
jgi:hypothetical protein